jgi:multicomponent Na+:H+ antiporter subunit D
VIGALACLQQRHLKRLLAFSTVSHMGVLVMALALVTPASVAGFVAYLLGHGMVKSALFMVAGILAARLGKLDEIALRGEGRALWPAGIACAVGALLLGGLPVGAMDEGAKLIDAAAGSAGHDWTVWPTILGTGLTGAAVLRAAGRVFAGLGPSPSPEESGAPREPEQEPSDRPLWLMLGPALVLLGGALGWAGVREVGLAAAASFLRVAGLGNVRVPDLASPHPWAPWLCLALTLWVAAHDLWRHRLPGPVLAVIDRATQPLFTFVASLHNGVAGDYVAWIVVGLAMFAAAIAFG